jgi:hypothetical protein
MGCTSGLNILGEHFVIIAGRLTPDFSVNSPDPVKNGNVLV